MRRHFIALGVVGTALVANGAGAVGSVSAGNAQLVEQRVAIAIGPQRATVWAQLRVDATSGPVGMIVPARPGASLDWASDAFTEALEVTTAPRILPPAGSDPHCPGETAPSDPVHVAGALTHEPTLAPAEAPVVLGDAAAVQTWAQQNGMAVTSSLLASLETLTDHRFVVVRFNAPDGEGLTPTLRVTGPDLSTALPFVLTQAGDSDVRLTTWVIGEGRAQLASGGGLTLDALTLTYDVSIGESDYASASLDTLASAGDNAWLIESSSHDVFRQSQTVHENHVIESLGRTYAGRAASYGGDFNPDVCTLQLHTAFASSESVNPSCARASLGVVEGMNTCTEGPVGLGELDPDDLRCGAFADDFAVALSDIAPANTWLTRITTRLGPQSSGATRTVELATGNAVSPSTNATHADTSACDAGGAGGGGSSAGGDGGGGSEPAPGRVRVPVHPVHTGCGSSRDVGAPIGETEVFYDEYGDGPDAIYIETECGGDTSSSYAVSYDDESYDYDDGDEGSCGGDTSSAYDIIETYETTTSYGDDTTSSDDDCGGDTSSSYEPSDDGSSSGDDCGGDTTTSYETTETTYDSGTDDTSFTSDSSSDGCSSDTADTYDPPSDDDDGDDSSSSDDGCSGDSSESSASEYGAYGAKPPRAERKRRRRRRSPMSKATIGAVFLLFPLRRLTRRRKRRKK